MQSIMKQVQIYWDQSLVAIRAGPSVALLGTESEFRLWALRSGLWALQQGQGLGFIMRKKKKISRDCFHPFGLEKLGKIPMAPCGITVFRSLPNACLEMRQMSASYPEMRQTSGAKDQSNSVKKIKPPDEWCKDMGYN